MPFLMQSVLRLKFKLISSSSNTASNTSYAERVCSLLAKRLDPRNLSSPFPKALVQMDCHFIHQSDGESSHHSAISFKLNIVKSMDRARSFQMGNLSLYLVSRREELNPFRRWGVWTKTCACAVPRYRCHSLQQWPNTNESPLFRVIFWPENKGWTFSWVPSGLLLAKAGLWGYVRDMLFTSRTPRPLKNLHYWEQSQPHPNPLSSVNSSNTGLLPQSISQKYIQQSPNV